jgi:hypothetical protein
MSVRLGIEEARARLTRSRFPLYALAGALVVVAGGVRARAGDFSGVDRTLLGVTLRVVIPLSCYFAFDAVHGRERTAWVIAPLARHGADRQKLTLGALLVLVAACALTSAVDALLAAVSAASATAGFLAEASACAWGGALTGAAYAGVLAVGSRWGRSGRLWLIVGDWLLGSGTGLLALPWARGHARNLLGGEPVLGTSAAWAAVALAGIATLGVLGVARRGPS